MPTVSSTSAKWRRGAGSCIVFTGSPTALQCSRAASPSKLLLALAELQLGGTGRAIVGRVKLAEVLPEIELAEIQGRLVYLPPEPRFPDGFRDWSPAGGQRWKQFYKTEDGKRYNRLTTAYAVKINNDGSFRIEDVPAGRYQLNLVHSRKSTRPRREW